MSSANSSATSPSTNNINTVSNSSNSVSRVGNLKICCACPETRTVRDQCIIEKGPNNCNQLIEAHKICLRQAGFKV
jgi:cytochrome c oxidase assembly protein subunit 17